MAATDDSGERLQIVRAHLDAEVGADAGALARRCSSSEPSDVVIEDGVLQALFKKRAGRAGGASAGLQSALQLLVVGRRGSAIALEQGMLEDRSEVAQDGRVRSFIRFTMAPFQWAKAAVRRQLPVMLQALFATSSDVDSDQIGCPNALVRPM